MTTFPDFVLMSIDQMERTRKEFRCRICWADPTNPHLCPHCSGIFCRHCLRVEFEVCDATSCPRCRKPVGFDAYVRSPLVEDIVASFRNALPVPQTCAIHPEKYVQVSCQACDKNACDQCWIDEHFNHAVTPVPAHTFAHYANFVVNFNNAMRGRTD